MMGWMCNHTWKQASKNTLICLFGCMSGDYSMLYFLRYYMPSMHLLLMIVLAMLTGLVTSITLETFVLLRELNFKQALITACGMSLFSMLMMEAAANSISLLLNDGNRLVWWVIIPSVLAGYVVALPYNYFRLKKYGKSCH